VYLQYEEKSRKKTMKSLVLHCFIFTSSSHYHIHTYTLSFSWEVIRYNNFLTASEVP
jgi:hypothetical protein